MKKRLLPFVLAGALTAAFASPASAQTTCTITDTSDRGGTAALAALIAIAADVALDVNAIVCDVDVNVLNNSLNNLLRNADIDVLNNSLNNILRNADIDVDVLNITGNVIQVNVLSGGVVVGDFFLTLDPA